MKCVAVIGLGNIATRHRKNLKKLFPNSKLVAMSASGRAPKQAVSDCDVIVDEINELINHNVELAIVASPAPFHAKHAIPLIEANIPVLIEKPLSVSVSDSELLLHAADRFDTPVAIGYCLRYLSSAIVFKELLIQQAVGHIYNVNVEVGQYLPDWRPNKDYRSSVSANAELGGGALLELSHELDYVQWLFGSLNVKHVILRSGDELSLDVEDCADIVAICQSAVFNIHLDFLQRKPYRKCRVIGSLGTLEWDLIRNEITLASAKGDEVLYSEPDWDKNQMYLNMVTDFISKIERRDHSCIDVEEAKQSVELIQQIRAASH
ncbi:Gfo/Idh/MocA family protein [Vibrio sp. 16]|uniref:Gfo/Idh/MocA family protein n=1 Tax=Vibrio sp. 16 TaxID=391586 RepID=UPI00018F1FD7|nr:Gfo/Idh/MocA family oxidoreductase [Vibrio sp. 16]EED27595.1 oxidoreductase [Vibrio sp. 16]CAK4070511.1 Inositol 2-dehydrogenase/D-chiro-inositol 3-dehydrogenase [Vibrio sp. 16]